MPTTQELDFSKFNITNANFDDINRELSAIKWDEIVNMPLNDFPSYFSNIVYSVLNKHCQINSNHDPSKKSNSTRKIGAINRKIRKYKAKIKFSDCNSSNKLVLLGKISQLEQSKKEIFLSKSLKEEVRAVNKIKCDSKYFFRYANRHKTSSSLAPSLLVDEEENAISEPHMISNKLQDQFQSVFSSPLTPTALDNYDFGKFITCSAISPFKLNLNMSLQP